MKKIAMVLLFSFTICSIIPVQVFAAGSNSEVEKIEYPQPEMLENGNGFLPRGAQIRIEFAHTLSSQTNRKGEEVTYRVIEDVTVDGKVLIKKGAIATGVILDAKAAKGWGKSGKLEVSVEKVIAVDGSEVKLATEFEDSKKWNGVKTVVGVAMLGWAFGGGMKGKKVNIDEGHQIDVFIGEDTEIKLSGQSSEKGTECLIACGGYTGPEFSGCMDSCKKCLAETCQNMTGEVLNVCLSKCAGK